MAFKCTSSCHSYILCDHGCQEPIGQDPDRNVAYVFLWYVSGPYERGTVLQSKRTALYISSYDLLYLWHHMHNYERVVNYPHDDAIICKPAAETNILLAAARWAHEFFSLMLYNCRQPILYTHRHIYTICTHTHTPFHMHMHTCIHHSKRTHRHFYTWVLFYANP